MTLSTSEFIAVRETANTLLEEFGLDAYIFEVEPKNHHCEVKVECACRTDGEWTMLTGFADQELKKKLFEYWTKKLGSCKKKAS